MKKQLSWVTLIVFLVLLVDQILKIWIKTNMYIGQEFNIMGDWFIIHFTENPGMAFGWEFGGEYGKIFLSVFRIIAVGGISWFIYNMAKNKTPMIGLVAMGLILAGAIGNILDSAFYGLIFSESSYHTQGVATMFPEEGGYAPFLMGRVVDMFYFPFIEGHFPEWLPFFGTDHTYCENPYCDGSFLFFRPVFNIADSSITIGISLLFLFHKKVFKEEEAKEAERRSDVADDENISIEETN